MNNMQNVLNVLIVDYEFHARKLPADYVSKIPFLHLVTTCPNVFETMNVMQKEHIDVLIVDIRMPDMTGIEFARSLNKSPVIIFSIAYSEYAVENYDLEVADYLLKSVEFPRFLQAVYNAKSRIEAQSPANLFMRVHKSYIVSIRHIESIDRNVLKIAGNTLYIGGKDNSYILFIYHH